VTGQPVTGKRRQRQEGIGGRRDRTAVREEKPLRRNPGRGCGVKQTREIGSGANRRGREKRRGRNRVGLGEGSRPLDGNGRFRLTPRWGRKPQGRRSRIVSSRDEAVGPRAGRARYSGGDAKHTAGSTARSHWPNGDGRKTTKATRKRQRQGGIGEPDRTDTPSHEDCGVQRIPVRGGQRGDVLAASQDRNPSKGNA